MVGLAGLGGGSRAGVAVWRRELQRRGRVVRVNADKKA